MSGHWTEELFVKHAGLYITLLEGMFARAEDETRGVAALLDTGAVEAGSVILDLNCGIGRHAIHLAKLGYHVVGVDISPLLVERARDLAEEHAVADLTEFLVGDARGIADALSGRRFDAVISMFTSLGYYDEETDISVLRQCRELTRQGGLFVLETGIRDSIGRNFQPHGVIRSGHLLLLHEREFRLETSRMEALWTFLEKNGEDYRLRAEVEVSLRFYGLHELIELFERGGWHYRAAYRDYELREPSLDGNRVIIVAEHL